MPRKQITPQIEDKMEELVEETVEETVEAQVIESEEKQEFRALIEEYKVKNPKKYAEKEQRLLEKLNLMK